MTLDDVKHFFYTHYAPNNAVIAISGNITLEQARDGLERWFGPIPARDIAPRLYQPEPGGHRAAYSYGYRPSAAASWWWPIRWPLTDSRDISSQTFLTDVLASGRSSRYYRSLVMADSLFTEADASIAGSEEPGFMMLRGRLTDASPEAVGHAVEAPTLMPVLLRLPRCKADSHSANSSVLSTALTPTTGFRCSHACRGLQELAMAEMHGEDINRRVATYRSVTRDDMIATAASVLDPSRACTLVYLPE